MKGMYDKLPHFVIIKNERFYINTDYRIFIDFEQEMQEIETRDAIINVLSKFYPAFFVIMNDKELLQKAIEKFIWFYKCGKEESSKIDNKGKSKPCKPFSYKYDDLYIWGAYKQYYNIDLTTAKIHWWKFKAMWLSLPDNAEFNKIKGYRTYTGNDKDLLELKNYYKLPPTEKEINDRMRLDNLYEQLK